MYVVLVNHALREAMSDTMHALIDKFPLEKFSIDGSEEKGYKLKIMGSGDEKPPRAFAKVFLKTWKPKPPEPATIQIGGVSIIPFPETK